MASVRSGGACVDRGFRGVGSQRDARDIRVVPGSAGIGRQPTCAPPMKRPGELLNDSHWALAFRTLQPEPEAPERLLVLLHGVGGEETQLAGLGARVQEGTLVVLPRGPRSIAGDRFGWFRVGFSEDGPEIVPEEAEESRLRLIEFLEQLHERRDVAPASTVIAGFSQGGIMSASVALSSPRSVCGFAVLCGRILPELEPALASTEELAGLQALVVHGRKDGKLPVGWAQRADDWLARLGVARRLRIHDAGHELTPAMQQDFLQWLDEGCWGNQTRQA